MTNDHGRETVLMFSPTGTQGYLVCNNLDIKPNPIKYNASGYDSGKTSFETA